MKAVAAFKHEGALVGAGAFSVIVKLQTSRRFGSSSIPEADHDVAVEDVGLHQVVPALADPVDEGEGEAEGVQHYQACAEKNPLPVFINLSGKHHN